MASDSLLVMAQNLYKDWCLRKKAKHAKMLLLVSLFFTAILLPFDYFFFGLAPEVTQWRTFTFLIMAGLLVSGESFKSSTVLNRPWVRSAHLVVPVFLFTMVHLVTLIYVNPLWTELVRITNYLVILYSGFLLHRFYLEHLSFSLVSVLVYFSVWHFGALIKQDMLLLSLCQMSSLILGYYYRKEFILSMGSRYINLKALVPNRIAQNLAIEDESILDRTVFEPTNQFVVCLCADWRNYQRIASVQSPEFISELFESFYNIVFEKLEEIVPSGLYYADWAADELFIVFYSNRFDSDETMRKSMRFAKALSNEVFAEIQEKCGGDLTYDIGIAAGVGLLGLQGPKQLKKTTITGQVAGTAKRFQGEAKTKRLVDPEVGMDPILVMDQTIKEFAIAEGLLNGVGIEEKRARERDIKDELIYILSKKKHTNQDEDVEDSELAESKAA